MMEVSQYCILLLALYKSYLPEHPFGAEIMLTAAQPWFIGMLQSKTCSMICPTT